MQAVPILRAFPNPKHLRITRLKEAAQAVISG